MRSSTGMPTLLLFAAVFLAVGWFGLTDPKSLLAPTGLAIEGVTAMNEMRANYGGMHAGMGVFFLLGALVPGWRGPALTAALFFVGGLVCGRAASFYFDGFPPISDWIAWIVVVIEVVGVGLVVGAIAKRRHPPASAIPATPPPPADPPAPAPSDV